MPRIRALVPLTHPTTGEAFAAGAEVDVDDEVFKAWRADGKVSSIDEEQAQANQPGVYNARTGREDTTSTRPSSSSSSKADRDKDKT